MAKRAQSALGEGEVHGLANRVEGADTPFQHTAQHLRALFKSGRPIIAFMAAGAVIRILADQLADKHSEPPVIAVSLDGKHIVPLLGGHHGANAYARALAKALGGAAAITTGSDSVLSAALDEPPEGWRLANPSTLKDFMQAAIAAGSIQIEGPGPRPHWAQSTGDIGPSLLVSDAAMTRGEGLRIIPPTIALGLGCERDTPPEALIAHAHMALAAAGVDPRAVAVVASIDLKADEPAMHAVGAALSAQTRFFGADTLRRLAPRLASPSEVVLREVGVPGVAEAAALAAAGPGATLILPKLKGARVTAAVARAVLPIDPASIGQARGYLAIVGLGPGDPSHRTPAATAAIASASDVVGYDLYLELAADVIGDTTQHAFPLGAERVRARHALALAAEGRRVALLASGDPGVYALATLALEELDASNRPDWNRVEVEIIPGVSAMQMAAARLGAPLGHDFCAISLSDLLTPWATIEQRLQGAAIGDFVVAFYNPVSRRRREGLVKARDILLAHRPADTPIAYARNLGRADERIELGTLGAMSPDACDMLTTVIVGSSRTRAPTIGQRTWLYTPRGYLD